MVRIDLNLITQPQIEEVFNSERLLKMFYIVKSFSFKEIPTYELTDKLNQKKMNFNVSVDYKPGVGFVYVTDRINKTAYEFSY